MEEGRKKRKLKFLEANKFFPCLPKDMDLAAFFPSFWFEFVDFSFPQASSSSPSSA